MKYKSALLSDMVKRVTDTLTGAAVILALLMLLFRVLTHFPFFDETIHVHYLWSLSEGLRPGKDFLSVYPVLAYLLTLPFMSMFPDSAFIILGLRSLSVVIIMLIGVIFYLHGRRVSREWQAALLAFLLVVKAPGVGTFFSEYSIDHAAALAAFGAMVLFFSEPRLRSLALASALSVLSVAITPKYPIVLFFGMLGYLLAYFLARRRAGVAIAVVASAGVAVVAGVVLVYGMTGTSLLENFRHSLVLQYRWNAAHAGFGFQGRGEILGVAVIEFLIDNPLFGIAVLLGVAGWAKRSWRNPDATSLGGAGILLGTLASSFLIKDYLPQYIAPKALCLALFVPYAIFLVRSPGGARMVSFALAVATLVTLSARLGITAQRFEEVPFNARAVTTTSKRVQGKISIVPTGILTLSDYDELLDIIPEGERVVAVWPFHPIFRRDQTKIGYDEGYDARLSFFHSLSPGDPYRQLFDPAYFRESMERRPPAMICTDRLENNYPPGWKREAEAFLASHKELYVLKRTRMFESWIRKDLMDGARKTW